MTTVSDGTTPFSGGADTVAIELPTVGVAPVEGPAYAEVRGTPYGDLPAYHADEAAAPVAPARVRTPSGAGRVVLPLGLALVSVVALGAGWLHLESDRAAEGAARATAGVAALKPPVPALGDPSAAASPAASSAATPAASTPASAPAASTPAAPAASTQASPPAVVPVSAVDRSVPVVVYNTTARTGLAAKVAASLKAKGWTVVSVGNWRKGGVSATTVFVSGEKDAAATMLDDLVVDGSAKAPLASMPKNRLVVVIGKDYPRT